MTCHLRHQSCHFITDCEAALPITSGSGGHLLSCVYIHDPTWLRRFMRVPSSLLRKSVRLLRGSWLISHCGSASLDFIVHACSHFQRFASGLFVRAMSSPPWLRRLHVRVWQTPVDHEPSKLTTLAIDLLQCKEATDQPKQFFAVSLNATPEIVEGALSNFQIGKVIQARRRCAIAE